MKKVCFIVTTPFAVNAFLKSHLIALSEVYEVLLCVNLQAYPLTPELNKYVRVIDVGLERKISPMKDLAALLHLMWILARERPAAVHSIMPKSGLLAMLAGFLTAIPRRYHTFTGQVWATKTGLPRRILKMFDNFIRVLSTQAFSDSPSQNRFLVSEGIARSDQISLLGRGSITGVDIERFRPDREARASLRGELGLTDDTMVFLFVGRITRDKGVFDLLKAFGQLAPEHKNCALWMVGPDDDGIAQASMDEDAQLADVNWLGPTDQPERFMAAADVLVLPSYREGFGQVTIEAAACGIPTIAYRIDGVIDAVEDQRTGLLLPCGDVKALEGAMRQLASNDTLRHELGSQAQTRAHEAFSNKNITASWVAFYQSEIPA